MPYTLPTTLGRRATPSPQRRVWSYDAGAVPRAQMEAARGLERAGRAAQQEGEIRLRKELEEREKLERDRAREIKNQAKREMDEYLLGSDKQEGLFQKQGSNAVGIEKSYDDYFKQVRERAMGQVDNARLTELLEAELDSMNTTLRGKVLSHQSEQRRAYGSGVAQANADNALHDIGYYYNDDDLVKEQLKVVEASVRAVGRDEGWDDQTMQNKLRDAKSAAHLTQLTSLQATDDPANIEKSYEKYQGLVEKNQLTLEHRAQLDKYFDTAMPVVLAKREYQRLSTVAPSDFEQISSVVIRELEGDDKIAQEPGGHIAKFGINSKAYAERYGISYPEAARRVSQLSREQARSEAKKFYWDENDVSKLPENMRMVAFDTYFNHGPAKAKELIKKSGNDPYKLLDLRMEEYKRLAKKPDYQGYMFGWANRLTALESRLKGGATEVNAQAVTQRAQELDKQYAGAGQELIDLYDTQQKRLSAAEKANKDAKTLEAKQKLAEAGGDYQVAFTSQERAEYAGLGIDITSLYKDVSDPAAVTALTLMSPDQLMNVDLEGAYADRLTYEDLNSWKETQLSMKDPASKKMQDDIQGIVNYYFRSQGLKPDSAAKDGHKQYAANMKFYIQTVAQKQFADGKDVSNKMLNDIAADYILASRESRWGRQGIKGGLQFGIGNVPKKDRERIREDIVAAGGVGTDQEVITAYLQEVQ